MAEDIPGIDFLVYDVDTLPLGMHLRKSLELSTYQVVVATGIQTGGGGSSVTITRDLDTSTDPSPPDPSGDPPSGVV